MLLSLLGARRLGHGRAWESYVALVALTYGIAVTCAPHIAADSQATRDLAWAGYASYVGYATLLAGVVSSYGLVANICVYPLSRTSRFVGAYLGILIWSWFMWKFALIGEPFTLGSFFSFWAVVYSLRVMLMALLNLPVPGQPGRL